MIVRRRGLITRMERVSPTLVRIIAPAGYGKSVLAAQLAKTHPHISISSISQLDDATIAQRANDWEHMPAGSVLVVGATDVTSPDSGRAEAALALFLERRPSRGVVIVISRNALYFHERLLPPHEVLTFTTDELRFGEDEIREVFTSDRGAADGALLAEVSRFSGGWPIVVLFLERLHREGRLEAFLRDPHADASAGELMDYLEHQVFSLLDEPTLRALVLAAAINELGIVNAGQRGWYANEEASFSALRERGLIRRTPSNIDVVPIVRQLVITKDAVRYREAIRSIAARFMTERCLIDAAEAYLAAGDEQSACSVLAGIVEEGAPYDVRRFDLVARQISPVLLCRHRRLWWKTIGAAWEPAVLPFRRDESFGGLLVKAESLPGTHGNALRFTAALLALHEGSALNALRILHALEHEAAGETERFRAFILVAIADTEAFLANTSAAKTYWERACEVYGETSTAFSAAHFLIVGRDAIFSNQLAERWVELQQIFDVVVTHKMPNAIIRCAVLLANIAQIRGNTEIFDFAKRELRMLEPLAPERIGPYLRLYEDGTLPLSSGGRGIIDALVSALVQARIGNSEASTAALALARERADLLNQPNITMIVDDVEAQLAGYASGTVTQAAHVVPFPPQASSDTSGGRLKVRDGIFISGERHIVLPQRSVQLLVLLAMHTRPVSREELVEALWPELNERSQMNAMKSCVHRTRALLGPDHKVLLSVRGGYAVSGLSIDIFEAERTASASSTVGRDQLLEAAQTLTAGLPSHILALEPFAWCARRVTLAAERAWIALGEQGLQENDGDLIQQAVNELTLLDVLNEDATSLLIRWNVQNGRRDEAVRVFQKYRAVLRDELSSPPSESLARLLEA